ncbi:MAG: hypothetical protein A2508_02470 [Candidatus Lambdaproteobacteria bacterium RIFOXYD12_FULL_49_8]|uniref:Uncharacterized protein n=1 Tax=Candidatus Lambdaproteobacteria bacterium RIFOXYD2_FULL_50_16 TaxID=1817772 RepID=A0A1F6G9Z2_9PROT|nr:MAG: hypothetical protein A2527_10070 [Candidatus Lambdaproteobacteria bacterium RIFOXYD2_FULL_50_16]OGG97825.1 MAG: hypothetical protein A2508_02470 [Candidatus Lambdaproteobacteria bacterium RIFOXYD12_FULL_49_8]
MDIKESPQYLEIQERLAAAIRAVIQTQIETKEPPETLLTLERLVEEGFKEKEALGLIGQAVSREVAELIAGNGELNLERYRVALEALPQPFAEPRTKEEDL